MKITSLELVGYKRFGLNNVQRFSIKLTDPTQLFLGTNGSGKSSLLGELTPLPAEASAYAKDGSKTIHITHRGAHYVLASSFSPKPEHSFVKDAEELNPGHTGSVQRELVRQHFNITPEIHRLLTGREGFCGMSPARRREWFTQLSDISYDYALAVFQRLKDRVRDTSGALKLNKRRLVAETAKVISPEEETKLVREVGVLSKELELLQSLRAPVEVSVQEHQQHLDHGLTELARLSQRLLQTQFIAPRGINPEHLGTRNDWGELEVMRFTSIEEITALIDKYRDVAALNQSLIDKAVVDHNKIRETVAVLQKTGAEGVATLTARLDALRLKRHEILSRTRLGLVTPRPELALSAIDAVQDLLQSVFDQIPENSDRRYSTAKLQEAQAAVLQAKERRGQAEGALRRLAAQKAHMDVHKATGPIECPRCKHQWIAGFSDANYQIVLEQIGLGEDVIRRIDAEILELEKNVATIREYAELYRDYVRAQQGWPVLSALWEYLVRESMVADAPRKVLSVVATYRQDLTHEVEAQRLDADEVALKDLISKAMEVGDANLSEQLERLAEVTLQIDTLTAQNAQARASQSDFTNYRRHLQDSFALSERIKELHQQLDQRQEAMVESLRRDTIHHCVRQVQHALVRKEEILAGVTLQKGIIADLEKAIAEQSIQEEAAKALQSELSPTDGLIAEGLLGFIRNFTAQMNTMVRKVWVYPLQIQDCGVSSAEGAELDYKFPMFAGSKANRVSDVSEGSTGMQEIVNMAFKIAAMRYLHLDEAPIFADEFGGTLDAGHRLAATQMLKSLMEQSSFSQLFMVSHDYRQYGSFASMEVCVLDPRNIVVPDHHNAHVSMS